MIEAELAQALQDTETAFATKFAKRTQAKNLGEVTNHNDSDIKGSAKTSGETTAEYTHLPCNGEI